MKKIILNNNSTCYEVKYIIFKKRYAIYYHNRKSKNKYLFFYRNNKKHRNCDLGPQFKDNSGNYYYKENNKFHNLYGLAFYHVENDKLYYINNINYTKSQFLNYINILNNLSYKRIY